MKDPTDTLISAISWFVKEESELLIQNAHEEAITGQLVDYLRWSFEEFEHSIDTQYDKRILNNLLIKKQAEFLIDTLPLHKWPRTWNKNQKYVIKEILPDIIFHNRVSSNSNYIIIEVKKSTNTSKAEREWDILKLTEMTAWGLKYEYGYFIDLKTGNDFDKDKPYTITLFRRGKKYKM